MEVVVLIQALAALSCKRRILLSGTPMQVGTYSRVLFFKKEICLCNIKVIYCLLKCNVIFTSNCQNDLEEFYAMVNFTNPGVLGDASHFRRYYEVS